MVPFSWKLFFVYYCMVLSGKCRVFYVNNQCGTADWMSLVWECIMFTTILGHFVHKTINLTFMLWFKQKSNDFNLLNLNNPMIMELTHIFSINTQQVKWELYSTSSFADAVCKVSMAITNVGQLGESCVRVYV